MSTLLRIRELYEEHWMCSQTELVVWVRIRVVKGIEWLIHIMGNSAKVAELQQSSSKI